MPNRVLWASFSSPEANAVGSYDVGNTADRVALVLARVGDGFSFSAASVGGQSLTLLDSTSAGISSRDYALFGGAITVTGTQSVVVNSSGFGNTKTITVLVYDGVASIRDAVLAWASSTTPAATLATQSGDLCVISGSDGGFGRTFTPESPAVGFEVAAGRINAEETATGSSTTVNGTLNGSANWEIGAWALVPASSSTPIAFTGTVPTLNGNEGTAFSEDLSSYFSGTETPFSYAVQAGTLPAGLTLNSSTGVISGTPTTAGTSSGIVVRGTDQTPDTADTNSFSIVIAAPAENPVITGQPSNATVKRGQTATFTVTATGSGTVTYQWQRNPGGVGSWADISGATSASYTTPVTTISGGSANDQDDYRCQVSDDDAGPVATDVVTLTVQQCVLALNSAGYEVLSGNAPATAVGQSGATFEVAAYPIDQWPLTSPVASASGTLNASHRLADLGDDDLTFGTTYRVEGRIPSTNEPFSWLMTAT